MQRWPRLELAEPMPRWNGNPVYRGLTILYVLNTAFTTEVTRLSIILWFPRANEELIRMVSEPSSCLRVTTMSRPS